MAGRALGVRVDGQRLRDNETPDPGTDGPLVEAIEEDRDLSEHPEAYGGMKVACERLVLDGAARSMVIRPGLIVGPGDPTGPVHRTGPNAGPADDGPARCSVRDRPDDRVQIIDARDIAEWIVRSVESGQTGVFDGVGPVQPVGEVIAATAEGVGTSPGRRVDEPGVPHRAGGRALDGRRRRCRCGCRGPSTRG